MMMCCPNHANAGSLVQASAQLCKMGRYLEAQQHAVMALHLCPGSWVARTLSAYSATKLGLLPLALLELNTLALARPGDAVVFVQRADVLRLMGGLDEAAADVEWALLMSPQLPGALACRGMIQLARGQHRAAASDLTLALDGGAGDRALLFWARARARSSLGRRTAALEDVSRSLELRPTDAHAIKLHAELLAEAGRGLCEARRAAPSNGNAREAATCGCMAEVWDAARGLLELSERPSKRITPM